VQVAVKCSFLGILKCSGFGEKLQILDFYDTSRHETSYNVANCFNILVKVTNFYKICCCVGSILMFLNFQLRRSLTNSFT
jgi:hypothetical protein